MKKLFKSAMLLLCASVFVLTSCNKTDDVKATAISLNKTTLTMTVGGTEYLIATLTPTDAKANITWTSSDNAIVSVNGGQVTANAGGTATITASQDGVSATCTVTVGDFYAVVEPNAWYINDQQGVGLTAEGDSLGLFQIIVFCNGVTLTDNGFVGPEKSPAFYIYMLARFDEQYIYVLGEYSADASFTLPGTFMPGVADIAQQKVQYSNMCELTLSTSSLLPVHGALTGSSFELDYVAGDYSVPAYDFTVAALNGKTYNYKKVASAPGQPVTKIKRSDVKLNAIKVNF